MDFLKHIADNFSSISETKTFIIFLLLLLIVVPMYFFKDALSELIKKIKFTKKKTVKKVSSLQFHDIFNLIIQVKNKIDGIKYTTKGIHDPTKSILIHLMIGNQLKETRKALLCLIKTEGIDTMPNQTLKFELVRKMNEANVRYTNKTFLKFIDLGLSKDDANYMLNEYALFRDEVMSGYMEGVESICLNNTYETNLQKISASFEVVSLGFHLIAKDSIHTCGNVNGRYQKYKDVIK